MAGILNAVTERNHHGSYERWVNRMIKKDDNFVPKNNGKRAITSFAKKKGHYSWKKANGWVDRGTHTALNSKYRKAVTGDNPSLLTYYYVATRMSVNKGYDNWQWIPKDDDIPAHWKRWKVGGAPTNNIIGDDWWYHTNKLIISTSRVSAGFIQGYYNGHIKGNKLWLLDEGYIYLPSFTNGILTAEYFI